MDFEVGDRVVFNNDSTLYKVLAYEHKGDRGTVRDVIDENRVTVQWDHAPLAWIYRKDTLRHVDEPFVVRAIRRKVAQYRARV